MAGHLDTAIVSPVLVGRDREIETLDLLINRARSGQGATLLVSGEAGIGKSRLIAEAARRFQEFDVDHALVLQGNCFEVDRDYPLAPLVDLLGRLTRRHPDLARTVIGAELSALMPEWFDTDQVAVVSVARDETADKRRLYQSIGTLFLRLADVEPLLVIIEDLHWADELTLELVPYLARAVVDQPILLLFSYRADEVHPALRYLLATLDRERLISEISLAQLLPTEIDLLLRAVFNQSHPIRQDFLDMVHALTDGNPFFIEEVLRALIASGDIYFDDGHWHRKETHALRVPRSVQDAVVRRTTALSDGAREVLSLAAVTGRHFEFRVIQDLTNSDEPTLLSCLRELIERQLIYEESADQFAFRHALTRQAIYSELLLRERQRLHRAVAEAIERLDPDSLDYRVADLSYHYDAAGVWEKSYQYAVQAGERAQSLFAPRAAVDHFMRALRAAQQLSIPPDPDLYQRRAQAYATLGQFDLADRDYEVMLDLARAQGRPDLEWEALIGLGDSWSGRDYDRSGHYFEQALSLARAIEVPRAVARSLVQLGNWQVNAERAGEAAQSLTAALELFEELDDQEGRAEAHDLLGVVEDVNGDQRKMRERYERAAELYRALDDRKGVVSVLSNISTTAGGYLVFETISLAGGVTRAEAESYGAYVIDLAREIGWHAGESFALITLGLHYRAQGDYARALDMGRRSLDIAEQIEHQEWMTVSRVVLGCVYLDLLDFAQGGEWYRQAAALASESASVLWQRGTTGFLASARVLEGRLDDAEAILQGNDDPLTENTIGSRLVWMARAKLALARGDASGSLEIVDALLDQARNSSGEQDIPALARHRAETLIALGRLEEAERTLRAIRSTSINLGLRPLLWQLHVALGHLLQRTGRHRQAEAEFDRARATIESISTTIPEQALREQFRTRAFATMPEQRDPLNDLTPRERDVTELVARGLTNREIADALFIGERTVETHVGNVLAKLGFSSRTQVAAWIAESRLEDLAR